MKNCITCGKKLTFTTTSYTLADGEEICDECMAKLLGVDLERLYKNPEWTEKYTKFDSDTVKKLFNEVAEKEREAKEKEREAKERERETKERERIAREEFNRKVQNVYVTNLQYVPGYEISDEYFTYTAAWNYDNPVTAMDNAVQGMKGTAVKNGRNAVIGLTVTMSTGSSVGGGGGYVASGAGSVSGVTTVIKRDLLVSGMVANIKKKDSE